MVAGRVRLHTPILSEAQIPHTRLAAPTMPHHKQVRIRYKGVQAHVDHKIAPFIRQLWRAGVATRGSCQDFHQTGKAWIAFTDAQSANRFETIFGEGSVEQGEITAHGETRHSSNSADDLAVGTVLYHTLFPNSDVAGMLARVRLYNGSSRRRRSAPLDNRLPGSYGTGKRH